MGRPLRARIGRCKPLITPVVSVRSKPNGLPIANTFCPTSSLSESERNDRQRLPGPFKQFDDGKVSVRVTAHQFCGVVFLPAKTDSQFLRALDDVVVGKDIAVLID